MNPTVLTVDYHKMVLTNPCPNDPISESDLKDREACASWSSLMNLLIAIWHVSVTYCFLKHTILTSTLDINLFFHWIIRWSDKLNEVGRHPGVSELRMLSGTSVRSHMLKVFDLLNVMEIMGCEIDREIQVDMILEILPATFDSVKLNCSLK